MDKTKSQLRAILKATRWSKERLADYFDVSGGTLMSWVDGKTKPKDAVCGKVQQLADFVLGVDKIDVARVKDLKNRAGKCRTSARKLQKTPVELDELTLKIVFHTDAMVGNRLSYDDILSVFETGKPLTRRPSMEIQETKNCRKAFRYLLDKLANDGDKFAFSPEIIQNVHRLMTEKTCEDTGNWRRSQGKRILAAGSVLHVPDEVANWCNLVNSETMDKIGLLAEAHARFEMIQPFTDYNGRVGRLLMMAEALKMGLVPPVILAERREAYLKYLKLAQTENRYDPLEAFIAEAIILTAADLQRAAV